MHFYTVDAAEVSSTIKNGAMHLEQVACYVNNTQVSDTIPLQRLYAEAKAVLNEGFTDEGVACYVFTPGQAPGDTVPLYRLMT